MTSNDTTQIRVRGNLVGIVGLQNAIADMGSDFSRQTDDAIGAEMVKRLSGGNYIPDGARDAYAQAFVREFKRSLGQPVTEDVPVGLQVLVLGPGCANCNRLETDVRDVLAEMNTPAEMTHVTDAREIGRYGVLGLPALVINNKIVSIGTTPDKKKIRQWLEEAVRQM